MCMLMIRSMLDRTHQAIRKEQLERIDVGRRRTAHARAAGSSAALDYRSRSKFRRLTGTATAPRRAGLNPELFVPGRLHRAASTRRIAVKCLCGVARSGAVGLA